MTTGFPLALSLACTWRCVACNSAAGDRHGCSLWKGAARLLACEVLSIEVLSCSQVNKVLAGVINDYGTHFGNLQEEMERCQANVDLSYLRSHKLDV